MTAHIDQRYPRDVQSGEEVIQLRLMTPSDQDAVLAFAKTLPQHDLLFLRRDISQPAVMAAWARELETGRISSLLALNGDQVVGCSAVVTDPNSFSPHVGDVRVVLTAERRAHGLGRILVQESFLLALDFGLEKLTAHMTADQEAAIRVFQDLGFRAEAVLRKHVRGTDGTDHDLVVLSHDVNAVQSKMDLYGLAQQL